MGRGKKTIVDGAINNMLPLLVRNDISFHMSVLGEVKDSKGVFYPIRRLEYRGVVILEQMRRYPGCDISDVVVSYRFTKEHEPLLWDLETVISMEIENDDDFDRE